MSYIQDSDRHSLYLQRLASGLLKTQVYPTLEQAYKGLALWVACATALFYAVKFITISGVF